MDHHFRSYRKAFTLIELLVVLSIIALLVAILLPALNRAMEQAYTIQCLSNTRQVNLAVQMYKADFDGHIPDYRGTRRTVSFGGSGSGEHNLRTMYNSVWYLTQLSHRENDDRWFQVNLINPGYAEPAAFTCPTQREVWATNTSIAFTYDVDRYMENVEVYGSQLVRHHKPGDAFSASAPIYWDVTATPSPTSGRYRNIADPGVVLTMETFWHGDHAIEEVGRSWQNSSEVLRHPDSINASYEDGSAESVGWERGMLMDWEGDALGNRTFRQVPRFMDRMHRDNPDRPHAGRSFFVEGGDTRYSW